MADERDWPELSRREKDARRVAAHNAGVRDRKKVLVGEQGMDPAKADRQARREQEAVSNKSWATYQRSDGHK